VTPYELLVVATALGVGCGAETLVDQVGSASSGSSAKPAVPGPPPALPEVRAPAPGERLLAAAAEYPAGSAPRAVATADFDGDGSVDLAVGDGITGAIHVLLNRGDGRFAPAVQVAPSGASAALVTGDFDGDGQTDLAGAADGTLTVLRNEGRAAWGAPVLLQPFNTPASLAAGDLDLDGRDDLLAASVSSNEASSRALEGPRGLALYPAPLQDATRPPTRLPGDRRTRFITIADVDGDGWMDVIGAAIGPRQRGALTVTMNLGGGKLGEPASYGAGYLPLSVAVADLDGDGQLDLCARTGSGIHGLLHRGQKFVPAYYEPMMDASNALAVGDLDGDGASELVSSTDDHLVVLRTSLDSRGTGGSSRGGRSRVESYDVTAATTAVADVDGDGRPDVIATGAVVRVLLQRP
jgi:hypothetical protein